VRCVAPQARARVSLEPSNQLCCFRRAGSLGVPYAPCCFQKGSSSCSVSRAGHMCGALHVLRTLTFARFSSLLSAFLSSSRLSARSGLGSVRLPLAGGAAGVCGRALARPPRRRFARRAQASPHLTLCSAFSAFLVPRAVLCRLCWACCRCPARATCLPWAHDGLEDRGLALRCATFMCDSFSRLLHLFSICSPPCAMPCVSSSTLLAATQVRHVRCVFVVR
jgi:hypothetical protein